MKKTDKELFEQFMRTNLCIPSPPDERDYTVETVSLAVAPIPEEYLRKGMKVLNQGCVGSCVAHAACTAMGYGYIRGGFSEGPDFSRGYVYGNRRDSDYQGEGMYIRQALKQLNHCGDCYANDFPYNESYPQVKARIENDKQRLEKLAEPFKIINYFRCYSDNEVKLALLNQGAVILSIPVYSSFSKECPLPTEDDKYTGNHAMCVVGWDKTGWVVQNSWSAAWGNKGFVHIPYEYPIHEFWGITVNNNVPQPKKKNIFVKILDIVKHFFVWIIGQLKTLFRRNK